MIFKFSGKSFAGGIEWIKIELGILREFVIMWGFYSGGEVFWVFSRIFRRVDFRNLGGSGG